MFVKSIEDNTNSFYIGFGKRAFDLFFSLTLIIALSPVLLFLWLLVRLSDGGPGLFKQVRSGRGGRAFVLYKFRTMYDDSESKGPGVTSGTDQRVTAVGKFLRKYKLDELPQLYNVLKGEMSFVGPRPESQKFVDLFPDDYDYILQISPGITDYAALEYRDEERVLAGYDDVEQAYINVVLPKKIILYRKYIDEISLKTDLKILYKTFLKVVWA